MTLSTVAAIITPRGTGGIAAIRISGSKAWKITRKIIGIPQKIIPNQIQQIKIFKLEKKEDLDRGMAAFYKAPNSFTGEDAVEIFCHGSYFLAQRILEEIFKAGALPAGPGEFSKRAFLNGKIDLAQAQAIADIISAKTDSALELALKNLTGDISSEIKKTREQIVALLVEIEAGIDYPEEMADITNKRLAKEIDGIRGTLKELLSKAKTGSLIKDGANIVIAGRPNVGKSSLFNLLCRKERAIVTEVPGTTRDFLEEAISINGVKINLIDTAGLRYTEDHVEKIGVKKAEEYLQAADMILYLISAENGETKEDTKTLKSFSDKNILKVVNKADLKPKYPARKNELLISVTEENNINILEKRISSKLDLAKIDIRNNIYISSERQLEKLVVAGTHIEKIQKGADKDMPKDLIAIDLKEAVLALGEITGAEVSEEVISNIFEKFCVGK